MSRFLARGFSPWRDLPLLGWLLAAAVVAVAHRWVPDGSWLMLHLVMLGAATHAILVWSHHFALTLLKLPATDAGRHDQTIRLALLAVGTLGILTGVTASWWPLTLAGAVIVATAAGWHGVTLFVMMRRALPARFRVSVRYYVAAACCLLVGITFGVMLAWGWPEPWHGRLLVAHALTNLLGWVGLSVTGTLLTLWPTMLRTRMDDRADRWTRSALPLFLVTLAAAVAGPLVDSVWLGAAGIAGYLVALVVWGRGLCQPVRTKPPREFAPGSVAAALLWLGGGLTWAGWVLVAAPSWDAIDDRFLGPAAALVAGFGFQVLAGALSYLLPSVGGGGPHAVRVAQAWVNKAGGLRLVAANGGLLLWLLPSPSWVKVTGSLLALIAGAAFLPLMIGSLVAGHRARTGRGPVAESPGFPAPSVFSSGQVIAGLTAVVTAVVVGVGVDPAAAGLLASSPASSAVAATGRVVHIEVTAVGMAFEPSSVHVRRGDRLVVALTNADATTHDLVIGQARTGRLAPGARAELDAGVIGTSVEGFCSVVGHRQMGMVFQVIVDDAASEPSAATSAPTTHGQHPTPAAEPAELSSVPDSVLPPLPDEKVHRLTLTIEEVSREVAPGVWQKRWTFNGTVPGPILHGRIGDTFEVTLVNRGSMGHSIDFHAGELAPDEPMRTIEPGQSLFFRFTANRAGIWMYHCATMPMTAHIAAGMAGAVIIEPDDLPPADRSYVLVQSEVYLSSKATTASDATEVDATKVSAETPDYVTFNGTANAYDERPLSAEPGERVRFWVLDAGPNRPTSFHIVGTQFDTVYKEGAYLLRGGRDAFGGTRGGAQALDLAPGQGGFVEAVFPEAGHYPVVSHVMVDAERGAHGVVAVQD